MAQPELDLEIEVLLSRLCTRILRQRVPCARENRSTVEREGGYEVVGRWVKGEHGPVFTITVDKIKEK